MPQPILQPGPGEGQDTYLSSLHTENYGTSGDIYLGKLNSGKFTPNYRLLFRFVLPAVPGNVIAATLTLYNDGSQGASQTAYGYRCTRPWTELGATRNTYDGVNLWSAVMGDWDAGMEASAAVGVGEDLVLDVTALVVDAIANRGNELSLLLKTAESVFDCIQYYSSDEAVETARRPKLQITYISAGSRVYIGAGGVENIDWNTPVAVVPDGTTAAEIPASLAPNRRYALAVRRISDAGVEEHNTHVVTILETDAAGVLQPPPLPRPFDLSFEQVNADTIRLGFSCDVPLGFAEPTEYRVYSDGGTGAMNYETPVATFAEHVAGRREFVVALPAPPLPLQLAVQARRDAQAGPMSSTLVVPVSSSPLAPAILPEI